MWAMRNDQYMAGQTQIIWRDPKKQGWKQKTSYRVYIQHRPKTGIIRLKIYEGSLKIIDSGDVIDKGLSGGRVGVRNVSTGGTGATAVAPKFLDTLTLSQPGGADSAHHCRGRT